MKKTVSFVLAAVCLFSLSACRSGEKAEIGLIISEKGTFQNNIFHQTAWKGIERYSQEHDIPYAYYEPVENYAAEYENIAATAVKNGAEVLVFPGYLLEPTVYALQDKYPDVAFVLLDGIPNNGETGDAYEQRVGNNTYSVMYAEEQAGFLAGYAAVMDGFRKLGFFGGMSVPAVIRFGYGYIQGAEYAAETLGLSEGGIELKYIYCGSFSPSPQYQAKASNWYWQGTEVIFACGGGIGQSVMRAAEDAEGAKWVIGVDTDQSGESDTVITSALKIIDVSVYDALDDYYNGNFPGGESIFLGADVNGVGLAMDTARFSTFNQAQYEEIFSLLATDQNGITSGILKDDVEISDIPAPHINLIVERFN